jgi:cytochrome c-type biogenesis protein CcmH/NrfF
LRDRTETTTVRLFLAAALLVVTLVALVATSGPVAAQEATGLDDAQYAEYEEAIATILCDCGCHPQSVKDCACGRAAEMRREIAGLIAGDDGGGPRTARQVIDLYVAEKGEQVLVAPEARGFNLLAWLGPLFALAGALVGVAWLARRWAHGRGDAPADAANTAAAAAGAAPQAAPRADDAYVRRVQQELQELE